MENELLEYFKEKDRRREEFAGLLLTTFKPIFFIIGALWFVAIIAKAIYILTS